MPLTSSLYHLKYAVIAILLWVAITAYPFQVALAGQGCGSTKQTIGTAFQNGYAYLATAVTNRGLVIMFFLKRSGDWQIIGIDDDLNACVVAGGDYWLFAYERGA